MKLRKYIALVLCIVLALAVFSGCKSSGTPPDAGGSPSPSLSPSPSIGVTTDGQMNISGAYASVDPETVMLTVDGNDVSWGEFFFYINDAIKRLQNNGVTITSWAAEYQDGITYQEHILSTAVNDYLQKAAIEYGARLQNVALTPEDETKIQADWDEQVENAGGEEAWLERLQSIYGTRALFMAIEKAFYLQVACFIAMYGENGSHLSDEDVAEYTAEDGYLMAKHILFKTGDYDETGTFIPKSDTDIEAAHTLAAEVLGKLKDYGGDDFDTYFDALMTQYSEDAGGLMSYPEGYLFQSGDMLSEFEEGTNALEIGQFSPELIETKFGYHIIYRIPINYDITSMWIANNYGSYSLRFFAAQGMFSANMDTWLNSLVVTESDAYKALDFVKMFAVG